MKAVSKTLMIVNRLGLHARAAAALVKVASRFECDVTITKDGQSVNGKSILGLMTLAAAKGSAIVVDCAGRDQGSALKAVEEVVSSRFGEAE
jgi:phosphocarrier protein